MSPGTGNPLALGRDNARLGLHADCQRHAAASTRGCAATARTGRHFEPQVRHAGRRLAERNRAAHLGPLAARRDLDRRVIANARLQHAELLVDGTIEQRLDLAREVEPHTPTERLASPMFACPVRLGSIRQFVRIAGRTFIAMLPRTSAR